MGTDEEEMEWNDNKCKTCSVCVWINRYTVGELNQIDRVIMVDLLHSTWCIVCADDGEGRKEIKRGWCY